jgi:hypothetical protein
MTQNKVHIVRLFLGLTREIELKSFIISLAQAFFTAARIFSLIPCEIGYLSIS